MKQHYLDDEALEILKKVWQEMDENKYDCEYCCDWLESIRHDLDEVIQRIEFDNNLGLVEGDIDNEGNIVNSTT